MTDFPSSQWLRAGIVLGLGSLSNTLGDVMHLANISAGTSAVWPTASTAYFFPQMVTTTTVVRQMLHENGTAVSGNVDVGIYDELGTRLVSRGGVAQAGISSIQVHDITDTVLGPGTYYLALVLDNTTGTIMRGVPHLGVLRTCGVQQMATAYPLPTTATFATLTTGTIPSIAAVGAAVA